MADAACSAVLSPVALSPIRGWADRASSTSAGVSLRAARSATPTSASSDGYGQPDATSSTQRVTCRADASRARVSGPSSIIKAASR